MKRVLPIILVALVGLGFLAYPTAADYLYSRNATQAMQDYAAAMSDIDQARLAEERSQAHDYNLALTGEGIRDPFAPGSGIVLGEDYRQLLNVGGMMGYITIPKIAVNLPVYHGTGEDTLQNGVGHLEGTALPVGGASTHTVLTGHTGLTHAKLFTDLTALAKGDTFYLHVLGEVLAYQVDQVRVVEPATTRDLVPVAGQDHATLITCTPYGVNSHRLLVRGQRIPYVPGDEDAAAAARPFWTDETRRLATAAGATAGVMSVFVAGAVIWRWRRDAASARRVPGAASVRTGEDE